MKLATKDNTIVSFSPEQSKETTCQVAINNKTFRVLSESLYKNKIGSVVREIASNAYDSHVQAKKQDVPFEIHLPTVYEPWFSVKDYGIGLSQEEVTTVYTTFFASTKDQSNDFLGAYGLGSKSWACISETCTVTSIKDHVKCVYSLFINEDGVPSILLLSKEHTFEPNGLLVQIPVESKHCETFKKEIQDQLRFFPIKPVIINGSVDFDNWFTAESSECIIDSKNIKIIKRGVYSSHSLFVITGIIGYSLEINQLGSKAKHLYEFLECLQHYNTVIFFNIGEIEVIVSREGISYTEKTINAIIQKLETIKDEIYQILTTEISSYTNSWEKVKAANKYGYLTPLLVYSGFKIDHALSLDYRHYGFDTTNISIPSDNNTKNWGINIYNPNNGRLSRIENIRYLVPNENTLIFIRDTNKKPILKLKEFYNSNVKNFPKLKIYVIESKIKDFTKSDIIIFSKGFGDVEIKSIDALPLPQTQNLPTGVRYRSKGYKTAKAYRLIPQQFINMIGANVKYNINYSAKYGDIYSISPSVYISSDEGIIIKTIKLPNGDNINMFELLQKMWNIFATSKSNISFPNIYLFNSRNAAKIKNISGWMSVETFIDKFLSDIGQYKKLVAVVSAAQQIHNHILHHFPFQILSVVVKNSSFLKQFNKKSIGSYPFRLYNILEKRILNNQYYNTVASELKNIINSSDLPITSILNKIDMAIKQLPLLETIRSVPDNNLEDFMKHIVKYVNLMGV